MEPHIPIENLLLINDATAETRTRLQEAFVEALKEIDSVSNVRTGQDEGGSWVRFYCEWEPPFKQLKKISKEYADASCLLLSDAFVKSHWLSKAHYVGGKGNELTISRVDDEFDGVFREIFNKDYSEWEVNATASFLKYE